MSENEEPPNELAHSMGDREDCPSAEIFDDMLYVTQVSCA